MKSLVIGLLLFALGLAACGEGTAATDAVADGENTVGDEAVGGWVLRSGTVNGEELILVAGYDATLAIEADGSIGGTAACNGYGGSADTSDGGFVISDVSSTEMGCEPGPMALESLFLAGLIDASRHEVIDGELRVFGDNVELRFGAVAPVAQGELVGTEWVMDTRIDGPTASTVRGRPTLLLNEDGTFTGSTGCRTLTGTWLLSDLGLQFPNMAADGDCDSELADQDGFVVSVIEGPLTVEIEGPRLTLTTSGGEGGEGASYRSDLE